MNMLVSSNDEIDYTIFADIHLDIHYLTKGTSNYFTETQFNILPHSISQFTLFNVNMVLVSECIFDTVKYHLSNLHTFSLCYLLLNNGSKITIKICIIVKVTHSIHDILYQCIQCITILLVKLSHLTVYILRPLFQQKNE